MTLTIFSFTSELLGQWREGDAVRYGKTIWLGHGLHFTANMEKDTRWLSRWGKLLQVHATFLLTRRFWKGSIIHKPPRGIWLHDDDDDEDDDQSTHSIQQLPYGVKRCLMHFAWLLMDDHLYFDAIIAANKLGNHFLGKCMQMLFDCLILTFRLLHGTVTKQYRAANKLISSIPGSIIDMAILQADCNVDLPAPIREFEDLCTRVGKVCN